MRDNFLFYRSFMDALDGLDDQTYRRLVEAALHYALDGVEPELTGLERSVFVSWRANIDRSNQNRDNGRNGGRPKKQVVTECETSGLEDENQWFPEEKTSETSGYESENPTETNLKEKDKENLKENLTEKETETYTETETSAESRSTHARFVPPTVGEVQAYCDERGYKSVDPEVFVDFYASKGWRVGREPMKDWRAAVRNWMRSRKEEKARSGTYMDTIKNRVSVVDTWLDRGTT